MTTVSVKDEYIEIFTALGDVQAAIDLAVQCYAISQITAKVAELKKNEAKYRAKYGMDYPTFCQRIGQDEAWILKIEAAGNKLWEIDLADWEFCHKVIEDWTRKLPTILMM
jgi:hypothetical protein